MSKLIQLDIEAAAAELDRRADERRKGESIGGNGKNLWQTVSHSSIFAPLVVSAIVAMLAGVAGLLALPASVQNHSTRIEKVEGRVDSLEREDIKRTTELKYIGQKLDEIHDELKARRRR